MRVLVIGSGGREHALCWKISQSTRCSKVYCAPGNGGIRNVAEVVDIKADDIAGMLKFAKTNRVDFSFLQKIMVTFLMIQKIMKLYLNLFQN